VAPRVLLTTIPKCGKNVLVSFFSTLGLRRLPGGPDVADAAVQAQARWFQEHQYGGTAPDHLQNYLSDTAAAFERVLATLDSMPEGAYLQGHFAFDPELHRRARAAGLSIVFVYRDPRAALASLADFLVERGEPAALAPRLPRRDLTTAQRFLVNGDEMTPPLAHAFGQYDGWRDAEGVIALRFEDVIGPRGHGSAGRQFATFATLAEQIGWQGSPSQLLAAVAGAFSPSAGTFRRGTIEGWQDDLRGLEGSPEWDIVTQLARDWGYPDQPEPLPLGADEAVLGSLLDRVQAERRQEQASLAALTRERDEYKQTIAQLQRRLSDVERGIDRSADRGTASRLADQVGRAAGRLASARPSRGKPRPHADS
jgi:hypothetical protein